MDNAQPLPPDSVAQRMGALGRLAGGVAHDLNNLLMVIGGYAEMLAQSTNDDPDAREAVQAIAGAAERAGSLARQLLLFSRRHVLEPSDAAIVPVVLALEPSLRSLLGGAARLEIETDARDLVARFDVTQIEHLLRLLVIRARETMPAGGRVSIQLSRVHRAGVVDASGERVPDGHYARLAISDSGLCLDGALRPHVFEPYLPVAKATAKGTGLALATVYGIVKSGGGFIDVTSAPDQGTTFEILLPLLSESTRDVSPSRSLVGPAGKAERP